MTYRRLRLLITAACIPSGLLAGATVDRFIVQFPAFRHLGAAAWAEYSFHADLGNGIFLYPIEGISTLLLLIAASLVVHFNRINLQKFKWPVYSACILSFIGLVFTIFAAPVMLGLPGLNNDAAQLQAAFDKFYFYSSFRAIAQVSVFFCCLWGMVKGFAIPEVE